MRKCLLGDVVEAAALIAARPVDEHARFANQLITQADYAHRYAKRFGRAHRVWGNGTLMARALAEQGPRNYAPGTPAFLQALSLVSATLAARKSTFRLASVATASHMLFCAQSRRSADGRDKPQDCRD